MVELCCKGKDFMEDKIILSNEKLEQVTGGVHKIIDNTDWRDLYCREYRPKLISNLESADNSGKLIFEWLIYELDNLVFYTWNEFIYEIMKLQEELNIKLNESVQPLYVSNTLIQTLEEIKEVLLSSVTEPTK